MPEALLVERTGSTAVLVLNRPEAGNSVNAALSVALEQALDELRQDVTLRALILRGAGERFFCTGGDIKEYRSLADRDAVETVFGRTRKVLDWLEDFPVPTIAAVEGHALGGGAELILACDFAVAGDGARIGFPQVKLGIVPGWNGIERLVNQCGRRTALRLVASGEVINAETALGLGMVDQVVPAGEAFAAARAVTSSFDAAAPLALREAKRLVSGSSRQPDPANRNAAASAFVDLWFSADHREAEAAFAEKREPSFQGA